MRGLARASLGTIQGRLVQARPHTGAPDLS